MNWNKHIPYLLVLLFIAATAVPIGLLELVFIKTNSGLSVVDGRDIGQIAPMIIVLLMVVIFCQFVWRDPAFTYLNHYRKNWRKSLFGFAMFASVTLAISIAVYSVLFLSGNLRLSPEALGNFNSDMLAKVLIAFLIVTVVALYEEMLFRVFIMRFLRWNTSAVVTVCAVISSSVIFVLTHHPENLVIWLTEPGVRLFIQLFLLGVLLCMTYIITGSIFCSIGLHAGLLYTEAFRTVTNLFVLETNAWWLPIDHDVRSAPLLWILLILAGFFVFVRRTQLHETFALESPVVQRGLLQQS